LTGGRVTSGLPGARGEEVTVRPIGTTDVDVIGADGSLVAVGGPAKAHFEEGTPQSVFDAASKILGGGLRCPTASSGCGSENGRLSGGTR
jgi:hypothetical protein